MLFSTRFIMFSKIDPGYSFDELLNSSMRGFRSVSSPMQSWWARASYFLKNGSKESLQFLSTEYLSFFHSFIILHYLQVVNTHIHRFTFLYSSFSSKRFCLFSTHHSSSSSGSNFLYDPFRVSFQHQRRPLTLTVRSWTNNKVTTTCESYKPILMRKQNMTIGFIITITTHDWKYWSGDPFRCFLHEVSVSIPTSL